MATAAELLAGTRERDIRQKQLLDAQAATKAAQAQTDARYQATGAQEAAAARQNVAAKLANSAIRPYRPEPMSTPSLAGAGRGMVNPPVVTPNPNASPLAQMDPTSPSRQDPANPMKPQQGASAALAAPVTAANEVLPGVFRQGNSFSDSAEGAQAGSRPAPVSAQNMAAADALAARYQSPISQMAAPQQPAQSFIPQDTGGYGLLDKAARQQRSLMMDAQQAKPGARTALRSFLKQQEDAPGQQIDRERLAQGAQESAADRMARREEFGAKLGESAADRSLRSQELADNSLTNQVKRDAMGVESGAAKQMASLRSQYLDAKTPEEAAAAAAKINALSGKGTQQDEYMAVSSGQSVDPATGMVTKSPDIIVNKRTGQPVSGQQATKPAQAQGAPAAGTVKGGYRFKGGDPSQQSSWEKV